MRDAHRTGEVALPPYTRVRQARFIGAVPTGGARGPPASTCEDCDRRHPLQLAQVGDEQFFGAAAVPVVVLGAAEAQHVLDDGVLGADLDVAVATGAAVELLRDAADQPGLVAFVVVAAQAPALAGQPGVLGSSPSRARRSRRPSPGWRRRRGAGRAWRRAGSPPATPPRGRRSRSRSRAARPAPTSRAARRGVAAIAWAAAKVSQIGPQRRNRCAASGEGSSWPSTRSVASGAAIAADPRTRSKAIMLRLVMRRACSRVIVTLHPTRSEGKACASAKWTAVTKTATKPPQLKSLSEYIQERFDEFSRSQKDVARYIVDHLDEAAFLTAEELARRASTSSSTVVRFSQALGFEGYPELQQAAIEEYRNATVGRQRHRRRRRGALLLRPLRARGLARRRPLEPRGNRAQPHPRAGRRRRRRARRSAARRDRRRRPDGLLRQLPAPHPQPARHPRRDRRQHRRRVAAAARAGSTRKRWSSCSPPAAPTRCCCGR